jgi:hypothetical protein
MVKKFLFLFIVILLTSASAFSQKVDTLVHINGNILTGEIKKLEHGLVYFSTSGMGTLHVETEKIKSLKSNKQFQITLDNGLLYFGSFDTVISKENKVKIVSKSREYIINTISLVEVFPIKNTFWLRVSGDFSLGGNYTKSTEILQVNFSGNLYYRSKKNFYQINWDNQLTMQYDSLLTEKKANSISYQRYFKNHYSLQVKIGAASNMELNLQSRLYLNVIGGRDLIHTNKSIFYTGLGLSGNKEDYVDSTNNSDNLEGIMVVSYDFFKRTDPEINVKSLVETYPSFTKSGRWRVDASLETRIELFNNFYIGIKLYYNFDNSVTGEDHQVDDWGINGTITYSFH